MARSASRPRARPRTPYIRRLRIADALSTWTVPAVTLTVLALIVLLNALGFVSGGAAAAIAALALLVLGAFTIVARFLDAATAPRRIIPRPWLLAGATLWVALVYYPLHCRIFPGPPLAHARLDPSATGTVLPLAGRGPRFDLVVDAQLPLASQQRDRTVHYDFDLVDDRGEPVRYAGELGDRWRTRRLGRRGTAPSHYEHLSTTHLVDDPAGGDFRLDHVALTGEPGAVLTAAVYAHRPPAPPLLYASAGFLVLLALGFDLWTHPDASPVATLLTTTAVGAVLTFTASGAGHPGVRDLIGAILVGGVTGVPLGALLAWAARNAMPRLGPGTNSR